VRTKGLSKFLWLEGTWPQNKTLTGGSLTRGLHTWREKVNKCDERSVSIHLLKAEICDRAIMKLTLQFILQSEISVLNCQRKSFS